MTISAPWSLTKSLSTELIVLRIEKVETLISAISVFFETLDKEKGSSQQTMRKEIKRLQKDLKYIEIIYILLLHN